jgi:hypothetical protein
MDIVNKILDKIQYSDNLQTIFKQSTDKIPTILLDNSASSVLQ